MGDQLDEPFGSSGSPSFLVSNIVFTLCSQQIKYDDDDDDRLQLAIFTER